MRYRFEYNGNPDYVTLHVTEKVLSGDETFVNRICEGKDSEDKNLLSLMNGTKGAEEVSLRTYSITFQRGTAFERDEVLEAGLENLKMWFHLKGYTDPWEQLKTLRSDIASTKCRACTEAEQREMAIAMRDFDTLDW